MERKLHTPFLFTQNKQEVFQIILATHVAFWYNYHVRVYIEQRKKPFHNALGDYFEYVPECKIATNKREIRYAKSVCLSTGYCKSDWDSSKNSGIVCSSENNDSILQNR